MVRWDRSEKWPAAGTPVIVVGTAIKVRTLPDLRVPLPLQLIKPEGYQIGVGADGATPVVWVAGSDERGVLLSESVVCLRELRLGRQKGHAPRRLQGGLGADHVTSRGTRLATGRKPTPTTAGRSRWGGSTSAPRGLRVQRGRVDPAAVRRPRRQSALPDSAAQDDDGSLAHRRRVRLGRVGLVSRDG